MRKQAILVLVGVVLLAIGAFACGDKASDKPPMTPDGDHPLIADGGPAAAPAK